MGDSERRQYNPFYVHHGLSVAIGLLKVLFGAWVDEQEGRRARLCSEDIEDILSFARQPNHYQLN